MSVLPSISSLLQVEWRLCGNLRIVDERRLWAVHCRVRGFVRDLRVTSGVNQSPI